MATDLFKRIETAWWVLPQSGWCQLDLSLLMLYPFASFPPPWQLHASELSRGFLPLPTDHNSRQCARPTGWQVHRGSLTKMTCPVDGVTMSPLVHPYPHYPTPDEALCLALQSSGRIHWVSSDVADWNLRDVGHEVKVTSDHWNPRSNTVHCTISIHILQHPGRQAQLTWSSQSPWHNHS